MEPSKQLNFDNVEVMKHSTPVKVAPRLTTLFQPGGEYPLYSHQLHEPTFVEGSTYYPTPDGRPRTRSKFYPRKHLPQRHHEVMELPAHFVATAEKAKFDAAISSHYRKSEKYKYGSRISEPEFKGKDEDFIHYTLEFYATLERKGIPHILDPFATGNANPSNIFGELKDADEEIFNMLVGCLKGSRAKKCIDENATTRSGHMVWKSLFEEFLPDCAKSRTALHTEMHNLTWKLQNGEETLTQFLDRAEKLRERILGMKGTCPEEFLINCVKTALLERPNLENFILTLPRDVTTMKDMRREVRGFFALKSQLRAKNNKQSGNFKFQQQQRGNRFRNFGQDQDKHTIVQPQKFSKQNNGRRFNRPSKERSRQHAAVAHEDFLEEANRCAAFTTNTGQLSIAPADEDKVDGQHNHSDDLSRDENHVAVTYQYDPHDDDTFEVLVTLTDGAEIDICASGATAAATKDPRFRRSLLARDPGMVCLDSGATVSLYKTEVTRQTWENFKPHVRVKVSGVGPTAIYSEGMGDRIIYIKRGAAILRYVDKNALRCTTIPFNILSVNNLEKAGGACFFNGDQSVIRLPDNECIKMDRSSVLPAIQTTLPDGSDDFIEHPSSIDDITTKRSNTSTRPSMFSVMMVHVVAFLNSSIGQGATACMTEESTSAMYTGCISGENFAVPTLSDADLQMLRHRRAIYMNPGLQTRNRRQDRRDRLSGEATPSGSNAHRRPP